MMQRLFPHALLACISEARAPVTSEIELVSEKVLREAFAGSLEARARQLATIVANVALSGDAVAA